MAKLTSIDELLADAMLAGGAQGLMQRDPDGWNARFPDLRALPQPTGPGRPLRICIATEDIVGPVRNGGIGTTYTALAKLLASLGQEVTILYLGGQEIENGSLEQWVKYYADFRVKFVPAPDYAAVDRFRSASDRWLRAPYNMFRYLQDHAMDVVHVSEWRGSAYLSLLAKRQGLAFRDTLFVVKTSSPWLWNRYYGAQPLERADDLAKVHAERQSVELADMVVGGSLHLIQWMLSNGYRVPLARTFVQPNVVSFEGLDDLLQRPRGKPGTRTPIDEFVFFGRLEARKGVVAFCQAIDRLIRTGAPLPARITFMGKPGARLPFRPHQTILEFIAAQTRAWPARVEVLTEFQQHEALQYLLDGPRLAVMPSVMENSSLAVYEAAMCCIPFVATAVGGTPELVAEIDHPHVISQAHPIALADKLAEAMRLGGYIARPSFDNDENLRTWREFHINLSRGLLQHLLQRPGAGDGGARETLSVCLYYTGDDEALNATLDSMRAQKSPADEVLVGVDSDDAAALQRLDARLAELGPSWRAVECFDLDAGAAFNRLAQRCTGDLLLLLWEGSTLVEQGLGTLLETRRTSGADVLSYFHRMTRTAADHEAAPLNAAIIGSVSDAFFHDDISAVPLLVRRQAFLRLGGFTADYRVLCHERELVARAQLAGLNCQTAMVNLGSVRPWDPAWLEQRCYDTSVSRFRAIRPLLAGTPPALSDLLLLSKGLQARGGGRQQPPGLRGGLLPMDGANEGRLIRRILTWFDSGNGAEPAQQAAKTALPKSPQRPAPAARATAAGPAPATAARRNAAAKAPARKTPALPAILSRGIVLPRSGGVGGRILAVRNGTIYGWVNDENHPERFVTVELVHGGEPRRVVCADAQLPLAASAASAVAGHGFVIPVFSPLLPWRLGISYRRVCLRAAGVDTPLIEALAVAAPGLPIRHSGFQGYCDPSDNGVVQGWVWAPDAPERVIDVAVFVDGRLLARLPADRSREDLRAAGIGAGHYGFHLRLDDRYRDSVTRRIDVVMADTGVALARGTLYATGQRVAPRRGA
ncbi:MAG: glycosyltransferase [Nevskia sp.]|nr:glycosyltransferase [Nevskia sp.]